jgi:hypothetical protein
VDLMRWRDGHRACNPRAVSGEEVASRAGARYAGAGARYGASFGARPRYEPSVTGSLTPTPAPTPRRLPSPPKRLSSGPDDDHRFNALPLAEPGNDGED